MSIEANKLNTLQQQLATLEELFLEVANQYEAAATTLREGLLPDRTPGFQLDAARKVLVDTLNTLAEAGEAYGIASISQTASIASAHDYLRTVIAAHEEAERKRKLLMDAHRTVQDARLLTHDHDPATLAHIHETVLQLSQQLDGQDYELASNITEGHHPISMLIAYAAHRDALSDEEYDAFRDQIEQFFGRPVLRDIDRGRIAISPTVPYTNGEEVVIEDEQLDTDNEIIDIIEETDDEFDTEFVSEFNPGDETVLFRPMDDDTEEPEYQDIEEAMEVTDFEVDNLDVESLDAENLDVAETEMPDITDLDASSDTNPGDETVLQQSLPPEETHTFWPPMTEDVHIEESTNGTHSDIEAFDIEEDMEIDEDFNPEEDTMRGQLSNNEHSQN